MPSLGYGVVGGVPKIRGALVSFSQNSPDGHAAWVGRERRWREGRIPGPGVAEPECRQHMQRGGVRAHVAHAHLHQDVVRIRFRVVDLHDPVAIVIEDAGIDELVFRLELRPVTVLLDQLLVRVGCLGIVVAPVQPGVAGHGVHVPPAFLDILAVVALAVGQPEHPLLDDGVTPVPEREGEVQAVELVRDTGHAVLVPAIGA